MESVKPILDPLVGAIHFTSKPLHPLYWPFPLIPVLHAARISMAFRSNTRKTRGRLSWGQDLGGYLLMCWGGALMTSFTLGLPPPMLISEVPWIVYPTVHILLSFLLQIFPLPDQKFLDTALPFIDALTRSAPIALAIESVRTHSNPLIRQSLVAQIVIAAMACAGGSIVATTLGVFNPEWKFSTPTFLAGGSGLLPSTDVWAGILGGITYGFFSLSHPKYAEWLMKLGFRESLDKPIFNPLEGRAAAIVTLSIIYSWKALSSHYLAPSHDITVLVPVLEIEAPNAGAKRVTAQRKAQ